MGADIRIVWDPPNFRGDWRMVGAVLETGHDLETAVLVSLFTWRTVDPDFATPSYVKDPQGWWADAYTGDPIGSRLWLLLRAKKTTETLRRAESYVREALQWLIDDGVAASVEVAAEWQDVTRLAMQIVIRAPADGETFRWSYVWDTLNDTPPTVPVRREFVLAGDGGVLVVGDDGSPILGG